MPTLGRARQWAVPLLLFLLVAEEVDEGAAQSSGCLQHEAVSFSVLGRYQTADLRWNVGGGKTSKLSELVFKDLVVHTIGAKGCVRLSGHDRRGWFLSAEVSTGRVSSGWIRDSDFGRGGEVSRSISDATGDSDRSESVALGWGGPSRGFPLFDRLTIWIGFDRARRNLRIQNGRQIIPAAVPGDLLDRLDSTYRASWAGPWFAIEPEVDFGAARVGGRIAFHVQNEFDAKGRWNLREDFRQPISYRHQAEGLGSAVGVWIQSPVLEHLTATFSVESSRFATDWGDDMLYRLDQGETRQVLRSVLYRDTAFSLGLAWGF